MLSEKYLSALKQIVQIWKKSRRFKTGFINKLLNVALVLAIILVIKTLIPTTESGIEEKRLINLNVKLGISCLIPPAKLFQTLTVPGEAALLCSVLLVSIFLIVRFHP